MFKEVQETDKPIETEKQRLSTAFENNKKNEGGETRHLKTINEQYEGQKYPGTDVEYKHERIQVNGKGVKGKGTAHCTLNNGQRRLAGNVIRSSNGKQFISPGKDFVRAFIKVRNRCQTARSLSGVFRGKYESIRTDVTEAKGTR